MLHGSWELNKYNLELTNEKLGHGQFGQVKKAYVRKDREQKIPVAVKCLKGIEISQLITFSFLLLKHI